VGAIADSIPTPPLRDKVGVSLKRSTTNLMKKCGSSPYPRHAAEAAKKGREPAPEICTGR